MIVVTGAAGFIGSALVSRLLSDGYAQVVAVDDFSVLAKKENLEGKNVYKHVHRNDFHNWLSEHADRVQFVFHIGARTDTSEFDEEVLTEFNLDYSKAVWKQCCEFSIPLVYASSAATYGAGEHGFVDSVATLPHLRPLNPYGWSKHHFDLWVQEQTEKPPFWAGFKFFNVFGPNEYHKNRMASVVYHAYKQVVDTGKVKLFRSHKPDFADGAQLRDFIYVKDVLDVLMHFMENRKNADLYNLGTGVARTFQDLAKSVFTALSVEPVIDFIDIPQDIRETYQYFTCASMEKIKDAGYTKPFTSLEDAVQDYVANYLEKGAYY